MNHAKFLPLVAALTLSVGSMAVPAYSAAAVMLDIDVAPPAPRYEVVPAARVGYVWAPGHYVWRRHAHVWVAGHWLRERRGYRWVADEWVPAGPRWHYVPGHWVR